MNKANIKDFKKYVNTFISYEDDNEILSSEATHELVNSFNNIIDLISAPQESNNLAHYTDVNGLEGMIKSRKLWVSHRGFMNDMTELEHANSFFGEFFKDCDIFVFSLSTEADLSHQWSTYGKDSGYCIVFDELKLIKLLERNDELLINGNVVYKDKLKTELSDKLNKYTKDNIIGKDTFSSAKEVVRKLVSFVHLLIKENNSYAEKEHRFCFYSDKFTFRSKAGIMLPYIKIDLDKKLPIKKIIIGPKINDKAAYKGLSMFLKKNGYKIKKKEEEEEGIFIEYSKSKVRY